MADIMRLESDTQQDINRLAAPDELPELLLDRRQQRLAALRVGGDELRAHVGHLLQHPEGLAVAQALQPPDEVGQRAHQLEHLLRAARGLSSSPSGAERWVGWGQRGAAGSRHTW